MKPIYKAIILASGAFVLAISSFMASGQAVRTENVDIRISGDYLNVNADIVLDSLRLKSNHQVFITPVVKGGYSQPASDNLLMTTDSIEMTADSMEMMTENSLTLPSVLVSGRNMHISFQRGVLRNFRDIKTHEIVEEVRRRNGKSQTVPYSVRILVEPWMRKPGVSVAFVYDSCGCGAFYGQTVSEEISLYSNPVNNMRSIMITPAITNIPVTIHEGRARVQFEVDRTELHVDPFRCKNGQNIDNRAQIQIIDDSVKYALTDPNVEISEIDICGYASPESPYLHNEELATGRSKALAEYLADRYNLPHGSVKYFSVPENWNEFRTIVTESNEITEDQRQLLLNLIDAPASTPEEWDRKEWLLKTDPHFSSLYRSKILPEWFPRLRATTFAIHTRLKAMDDQQLAEVIKKTPEKMSLNQMYRVARLYPEGSDEFNDVIATALKYYPKDQTAIVNAATAAVIRGDYDAARDLLANADNTPEVFNLLGIIATAEENFDVAIRYFEKAGDDVNAVRNLEMLK